MAKVIRVGLTGIPGAGKSTFARNLSELGACVIDVDDIGRHVVEDNGQLLADLAAAYGRDILDTEGKLNRRLLAARAFVSDSTTRSFNAMVWPAMLEALTIRLDELAVRADGQLLVADMAVLFEAEADKMMDHVVVVTAPAGQRHAWLARSRSWTENEILQRESAQISENEKLALADSVIVNDGSLQTLRIKAEKWLSSLSEGRVRKGLIF